MKEIKENMSEWKDILFSRIRRILLKCPYYPKWIYRFSTFTIKTPKEFFTEIEKKIPKINMEQKTPNSKNNLNKMSKRVTHFLFKITLQGPPWWSVW